jgi:hypothetical protein|tara:strand:+ start:754 stop:1005 length:252 start_codon:yes stop_codon:yes gene_type:complete
MTTIWDELDFFTARERWGVSKLISGYLLLSLDLIRAEIDTPIIIIKAYATSGHATNSLHYHGLAVDFYCPNISPREATKRIIK